MSLMKTITQLPIDFEDLYYDITRPFRRATRALVGPIRLKLFPKSLHSCEGCGAVAEWSYVPAGHSSHWCDNCIPRGCGCNYIFEPNDEENAVETSSIDNPDTFVEDEPDIERAQRRDNKGRLLPCAEYWYDRWGWPKRPPGWKYKSSLVEKFFETYRVEKMAYYAARQNHLPLSKFFANENHISDIYEDQA